ncbi:hypothetical protein GDO78_018570 [Eleutherodactylus coqui]|uniref:Uncharacterized protein n=1 Tax=Eleutherodactylus coqui TaxID=57060 RepID=A0A8J6E6S2_ELECQ|nr:hypothetical protein GDO78_018570 [Eleutherodactylus coqui]
MLASHEAPPFSGTYSCFFEESIEKRSAECEPGLTGERWPYIQRKKGDVEHNRSVKDYFFYCFAHLRILLDTRRYSQKGKILGD